MNFHFVQFYFVVPMAISIRVSDRFGGAGWLREIYVILHIHCTWFHLIFVKLSNSVSLNLSYNSPMEFHTQTKFSNSTHARKNGNKDSDKFQVSTSEYQESEISPREKQNCKISKKWKTQRNKGKIICLWIQGRHANPLPWTFPLDGN